MVLPRDTNSISKIERYFAYTYFKISKMIEPDLGTVNELLLVSKKWQKRVSGPKLAVIPIMSDFEIHN